MILKYLQGGNALPPLVSYQPVTVTGGATAGVPQSSSKNKEESSDLTDKDLLKMLEKLDGLPSDMAILTNTLSNFYIDLEYGILPSTSNIASRYISILNLMKVANFNKKEYDDAFNIVSKNGGINELAISDRGLLYCVNKDLDFKLMTIDELKNNSEYLPLTNSELLYYRAQSPDLANNNGLLKVVKNGIGIETVTKLILDGISKLGSSQESLEGYMKTRAGRLISGLEDFMKAVGEAAGELLYDGTVNDLYKYKYLNKDQAMLALEAIRYIYQTLPENAKTLLKLKAKSPNDQEALNLIASLISSLIDTTKDFSLDLVGGKTAKSNSKDASAGKDNTDLKTSFPLSVMKSLGGYDLDMMIDTGNGSEMSVSGTYYPQLKTTEGKPIINTSLEQMLASSGLHSIITNPRNITFGDLRLSTELLANITYNNTGLIRANLPVNEDGTVRLSILLDFELAMTEIKLEGENVSNDKKAEIFKAHNLDDLLRADGSLNPSKVAPFIVTEGYTTERNGIKDSEFVYKPKATDLQIELIKESLTTGTGKDKKVPEIDTFNWMNPFDYFGVEDIYRAAIYIPISNNVNSAVFGANLNLDFDESLVQEEKYRNFEKRSRVSTTSADIL